MKLFLFAILSLLFSGLAMSMTIEEYYALAPEMEAARAAISTTIYAICTGSIIAFYLFGWEAPWILRLPIGLVLTFNLGFASVALYSVGQIENRTSWEYTKTLFLLIGIRLFTIGFGRVKWSGL